MAGHRNPRCWSSSELGYSVILSAPCEEDVPVVQSRECPPHCGVWSSSLLSSPPMCDWAEMETRSWGLLVGTCLERLWGISGTFRSNGKVRFTWFLLLGDHLLRAAGSEVSLQFTKILIQVLKYLAGYLTAHKQVRGEWEWNPGSLCPRALSTRLSFLTGILHDSHLQCQKWTHISQWRRNVPTSSVTQRCSEFQSP